MSYSLSKLPDLSITAPAQTSNVLNGVSLDDARALMFGCTAIDGATVYQIQWCQDLKPDASSTWFILYESDGATKLTAPKIANTAKRYEFIAGSIRIVAEAATGADCNWKVSKVW